MKTKTNLVNVSDIISVEEFENIQSIIIQHGDRMSFRNIDGDNPYYKFKEDRVFLGTFGVDKKGTTPDYYEIIFNPFQPQKRFTLIKGEKFDAGNRKLGVVQGMKPGKIYLTSVLKEDIEKRKDYLKKSKKHIFSTIKNTPSKPLPIFHHVEEINASELDSVVLFSLIRSGIDHYKRGEKIKNLSQKQITTLITILKDNKSFYGGTPLMFQFSFELVFYKNDNQNSLYFSSESKKLMQNDFEIPHNKIEVMAGLRANYFPFLTKEANDFFGELIKY